MSKNPILLRGGDTNLYGYVGTVGKPGIETNLYSYSFQDPVNFIDPDGKFPKNLDEAGECILGNPLGVVDNLQRNIHRNQSEIQSLQNQQSNGQVCQDSADGQKRINSLREANRSLQVLMDQTNQKCSGFYRGGM